MVTVRVPGKLMLMGEHAVVYGFPCIVTTVNRYITVNIKLRDTGTNAINISGDDRFVRSAIDSFRKKYKTSRNFILTVQSDITGYGLGSSAAVTAACICALATLEGIALTKKELFNLSYQSVLSVQKRGSGFDVAASIYGETISFNGATKDITPLYEKNLPLLVAYCGVKADTVVMMKKVEEKRWENAIKVDGIFEKISALVTKARIAIQKEKWELIGRLFGENQTLLRELGVSTDKIDKLLDVALKAGAYGAKLSGAGGGDCIIALVPDDKRGMVANALTEAGGEVLNVKTGVEGVKVI